MDNADQERMIALFEAFLVEAGFEGDVRVVEYNPDGNRLELTAGVFTEYELRALSEALMMTAVVDSIHINQGITIAAQPES